MGLLLDGHTAKINSIASRPLTPDDTDHPNVDETALPPSLSSDVVDTASTKMLVASGGEDCNVVCWDISSMRLVTSLKNVHQKFVKAVEWSGDGRFIISGDKGGAVVLWSPFNGKMIKKQLPDKSGISCISASPTRLDTVAIGLESGDILMCQVSLVHIVVWRRLHGHTDRIQSLSWQQPSASPTQDFTLLASGSADLTIRTWDVEKESSTNVFTSPDSSDRMAASMRSKIWVPVAWGSEGQDLLSCSIRGIMVRWSMQHTTGHFTKIMDGKTHNRVVYQIMTWPSGNFAFTISMDRKIVVWDLDSNRGIAEIDCMGGSIYSLDINPQSPGRVAMGLGNETIKIWNTLSQDEPYESFTIERLQSKVRAVKWHPLDEETICFGLENGKIGMVENIYAPVDNSQGWSQKQRKKGKHGKTAKGKVCQKQTVFQSYHEGAVTRMAWCSSKAFEAPVPEFFDLSLRGSAFFVVSCGSEGKIQVTDSSRPTERSFDLEVALQKQNLSWYQSHSAIKGSKTLSRRDFAIHPNEDLMAIGNGDGSVEVFELKYFKLVYVYQGHKRRINRLCWRGGTTQSDGMTGDSEGSSTESYLLAAGSDDGTTSIHMLEKFSARAMAARRQQDKDSSTFNANTDESNAVVPTTYPAAFFRYHAKSISDLAWSPHRSNSENDTICSPKLVSSSFDGKAIVYQLDLGNRVDGSVQQEQCMNSNDDDNRNEETRFLHVQGTKVPQKIRHRVLACYSGHQGQVVSVHWSMTDVDRIFSGGADWRTCCWDWKSHTLTDIQVEALKKGVGAASAQSGSKASSLKHKLSPAMSISPSVSVSKENASKISLQDTQTSKDEHDWTQDESQEQQSQEEVRESETGKKVDEETEQEAHPNDRLLPDGSVEHEVHAQKRGWEQPQLDESSSKRVRIGFLKVDVETPSSSGDVCPPSKSTASTTIPRKITLFPTSSAAFQVQSKEKVHLEIIRLARNLFCRRLGQGGTLLNEQEVEDARKRWRTMREFFEKDGEKRGINLSRILGSDIDEMNLVDDDEKGRDQSCPAAHISEGLNSTQPFSDITAVPTEQTKDGLPMVDTADKDMDQSNSTYPIVQSSHSATDPCLSDALHGDDSAPLSGDLVFYGSRESVKALAEMEAEEMAKNRSQSNQGTVFTVGSGLGVLSVAINPKQPKGPGSEAKSKRFGQLSQIPVSYWLGDVPKIVDILGSLLESELGIHDWIGIALSPMGGVDAWKTMMARTAAKFESAGEVHAAALCYLGIGNVFEAVDAYRKLNLYREALMLLRIRLWDDDDERSNEEDEEQEDVNMEATSGMANLEQHSGDGPSIHTSQDGYEQEQLQQPQSASKELRDLHARILAEWGHQQERRGLYEQACKCQLTLASVLKRSMLQSRDSRVIPDKNKMAIHATPSIGLQTLARRADPATLRTVAGLAILLQDPSREERVSQYETAIAHKRLLDLVRNAQ
ncbi:WD40-repeat-containing domain protein [Mortierella sp. GBAus27b]|nr:WD40-repeat-containing domain protein [Mortierella sp. GBAus27b]